MIVLEMQRIEYNFLISVQLLFYCFGYKLVQYSSSIESHDGRMYETLFRKLFAVVETDKYGKTCRTSNLGQSITFIILRA